MMDIEPIDELREVRRRLSDLADGDVRRYAQLLRDQPVHTDGPDVVTPIAVRDDPSDRTSAA